VGLVLYGLMSVFGFGLVVGFLFGLMKHVSLGGVGDITPSDPPESWRRDRNQGLVGGLVFGLVAGFLFGLMSLFGFGLVGLLLFGLMFGLMFVLGTATWATALACALSTFTHGTPLRMIRFLEDARARNVLRTVGPVYQFRHARLQDRLADRAPAQPTAYRTPPAKPRGI
jgi:hypothetical protein